MAARVVYALPLRIRRHIMFLGSMKRLGHFRRPRTFSEKVNWRILRDRRPEITWACDKLLVKEQARCHGINSAKVYWSGTNLAELVDVELPAHWVLKPNHRSRCLYFGSGVVTAADIDGLQEATTGWMKDLLGAGTGEWAYTQVTPCFFVEERLGDGSPVLDYRLFTYAGDVHYVQLVHDVNRVTMSRPLRRYYTGDWKPLEVRQGLELAPVLDRPASFDAMLKVAWEIGESLDFARIDLYDVNGELYLGEVTLYPTGGLIPFQPPEFDLEMGELWTLPRLDRRGRSLP